MSVAKMMAVLTLAVVISVAASRGWIPVASHTIAAVMLAALAVACAVLLIRQIRADLREPCTRAPVLPPAADGYLQLARRSGRPLGVIRAVAQGSDRQLAPRSAEARDRALSRSLCETLRSVDLVAPSIGAGGAEAWIVCPDTDAQGVRVVQQRLRHVLADGQTSVRFGVTSFPEDGFTLDELLELAAERASPGPEVRQGRETAALLPSPGQATES